VRDIVEQGASSGFGQTLELPRAPTTSKSFTTMGTKVIVTAASAQAKEHWIDRTQITAARRP
jgi:hypothetical protein